MIKVICIYGIKWSSIISVRILGHANFSKLGSDIVCSSVSSIAFGSFSFLKTFHDESVNCEKKNNELSFYSKKFSETSQVSLFMMIHQLENISNFYPDYLEIKKFLK